MKKHEIVRQFILNSIANNSYMQGRAIDSENELARRLQVSRETIRKTLEELCSENVLFKIQGKGTFVSEKPRFFSFQCGIGFSSEIRKLNLEPGTANAEIREEFADEETRSELQLSEKSRVWKVLRVRTANGVPVAYEASYFPYLLIPDLDEKVVYKSIYSWLETKGISFYYADQSISAILADKSLAAKLKILPGVPLVKIVVTAYTKQGTPINFGQTYYITDRIQLNQTVYKQKLQL